jgi:hypothetical protein
MSEGAVASGECHVIRLRGPWRWWPADGASQAVGGRVQLPNAWSALGGPSRPQRVRLTRTFHRPTGLSPAVAVRVIVDGRGARGELTLNGKRLGALAEGRAAFDVTGVLTETNELVIEAARPPCPNPGPLAHSSEAALPETWLEIHGRSSP